jgi:hypothetical protein
MNLKPDYDFLPQISAFIGIATSLVGAFTLAVPPPAAKAWRTLPRSAWPGRILAAVCILWSALWLCVMPLGPLSIVRDYLWLLIPIAVASVCVFTPELLTCRSIGGILVLLPAPMLSAAAWHPSPFRYVILVYAYAMIIAGMYYIALPWLLRDHINWSLAKPLRSRAIALGAVVLGLFITVLAFTAYRAV